MTTTFADLRDPNPADAGWCLHRCHLGPTHHAPLAELLHAIGAEEPAPLLQPGASVPIWHVGAESTLLHEGSQTQTVFIVRSGTFKCLRTFEDGYEQVLSFADVGEVLGFEALSHQPQSTRVVALEHSTVFALPLRDLHLQGDEKRALDNALQGALSRQLGRAAQTAEIMAAVSAEVRLARFLVRLSERMAERGQSPRRLYLRMGRRDIASLLGVAHETVSRSFSALAAWGYLRVENREVEILDMPGLQECTRSTRGLLDEPARGHGAAPQRLRVARRLAAVA